MKFVIIFIVLFKQGFAQEFPQVDKINPFTGEKYDEVLIGEVYKTRNHLNRAITLYNIKEIKERLHEAPSFQEECHEHGERFANWSYAKRVERTINAGISFNLLGIDFGTEASITKSFEFNVQRWVRATFNVQAVHTPYMQYKVYEGITYLQQVNIKTKKSYIEEVKRPKFYLDYIDPKIYVERIVIGRCLEPHAP